jgi:hypothetical protein
MKMEFGGESSKPALIAAPPASVAGVLEDRAADEENKLVPQFL